jgi:hypothetical protein
MLQPLKSKAVHNGTGDAAGAASGLISVLLASVMGWIDWVSLGQAFLMGAVGAAGGYAAKKFMDFLIKHIKQLIKRKSK